MASQSTSTAATTPSAPQSQMNTTSVLFQLPPGLYALRLDQSSGKTANPVMISRAPGGRGEVDFLGPEAVAHNTLTRAEDCLAIRIAREPVMLIAVEFHTKPGKPTQLKVERLDVSSVSGGAGAAGAAGVSASAQAADEDISVQLLGHVQGLGDVVVRDDWLGDPESDRRIEGFAIRAEGLPDGVQLAYGCKFMSSSLKPEQTVAGKFIGTRRKAQAIKSLSFGLKGEAAHLYELSGEVAFSNQAVVSIQASKDVKGPTGKEYVVAIKLQIHAKASAKSKPKPNTQGDDVDEAPDLDDVFAEDDNQDQGLWSEQEIAKLFAQQK